MNTSSIRLLMAAALALSTVACTGGSAALLPQTSTHAALTHPQDVGGGILPTGGNDGGSGGTGP